MICSPHPKVALCDALCFARSAVVWVARRRQVIVTCWCRPAEFLASRHSKLPPFAGMIDSLLESARFDGNLRQVRVELGKPNSTDKSRNEALDEHELFAGGELADAMHEFLNRRVVQPFVEGTMPCIDDVLLRDVFPEALTLVRTHPRRTQTPLLPALMKRRDSRSLWHMRISLTGSVHRPNGSPRMSLSNSTAIFRLP